jgi:restriction system protein
MTDIDLGRIGELLRGLFELLWTKPEGLFANNLLGVLPQIVRLTDYEKEYSSTTNRPRYERIIQLATIPLFKVGWLAKNDKGRWFITDEGRDACKKFSNPQDLYREALTLFEERRQNTSLYNLVAEDAAEKAWEQIHKFLESTKRIEFLRLIVDLLTAMGYHIHWVAPPEKNHGQIDIVAFADPVGVRGSRILVQAKHTGQAVTMEGLKTFSSAVGTMDYGLFISTGGFTNDVMGALMSDDFPKITLWDLEKFFDLWIVNYDNLSKDAHKRLPLKSIYFLYGLE